MVKQITDASFEVDVLKSDKPVLVDFWAEWCGPCRQIAPILDQLSQEIGDKIVIGKINIDENPETPRKLAVKGIPTMMIFINGENVATKVGSLAKTQLLSWVDSVIDEQ